MHLKILMIFILVLLIMSIAKGITKQYKEKCDVYNDLLQFLNNYELNIGFKKDKLLQLVTNFNYSNASKELFESYTNFLTKNSQLQINIKNFDEDNDYIKGMLTNLGHCDYDQEIKKIASYKCYLEKQFKLAEEQKNKFCPLCLKLSFLFALVIAILII